MNSFVSQNHIDQYRRDGYCILENALPQKHLDLLREECAKAIANVESEMDDKGVEIIGGNRRGRQYSPWIVHKKQPRLLEFLLSDYMAQISSALLANDNVYLFSEQYMVKFGEEQTDVGKKADFGIGDGPQAQGAFSWHQDSGYVPVNHKAYITYWIALDDITENNGAVRILPFSDIGVRTRVQHEAHPVNGDLVGYFGEKTGVQAIAPAGSIICFSSMTFHSSDKNHTDKPRRGFIAQYSPEPILTPDGEIVTLATPVLVNNKFVGFNHANEQVIG